MAVSVETMKLTLSMAIMQVTTFCIYACFEVVLSITGMLVDLSVTIMQVTVSVAIMQLEVSVAHMQVTVSAANMWMNFYCNYGDGSLCHNYAGGIFCSALCT